MATASLQRTGGRRLRNAAYRSLVPVLLLAVSAAAAASGANAPLEYLDEETGATVFFVGRPLVFAHNGRLVRARPDDPPDMTLAPRDYVSPVAAAVDRSGKYTYVLIGYFWLVGTRQPTPSAQGTGAAFTRLVSPPS